MATTGPPIPPSGLGLDEVVKMVYDDQDWAIFGSISSESTHIALRVALRAEIPIVNSASTDPPFPRLIFPGTSPTCRTTGAEPDAGPSHFYRTRPEAVAILRVNNRYGRFGFQVSRRRAPAGPPVVIEQKYLPGDADYSKQLQVIARRARMPWCYGRTSRKPRAS